MSDAADVDVDADADTDSDADADVAAGAGTDAGTGSAPDSGGDPDADPEDGFEFGADADEAESAGANTETFRTTDGGLLQVTDLDAGYGDLQVLSGVDMNVEAGEYVTIVGPNGAGKSTVMKSIFGLATHMGGRIEFRGEEIQGTAPEEVIHLGIGYVPQEDNVFTSLSVRENLEMGAYVLDEVPEDRLRAVYDRFPILEERNEQTAGTLSGGQRQMLAMGRALMLDPELLMLDEPSAGLAPDLVSEMFDRIDRINESGTSVLMVEQNAKEALRRCDRGYVLVQGENRYMDEGDVLLADEQVRRDFLGG